MKFAIPSALVFVVIIAAAGCSSDRFDDSWDSKATCATALPETPARPVWRKCAYGFTCFYCANEHGMLIPVIEPGTR
ncbi:hypothetical protein HY480_01480 [Candidatus Uhrbacteria bacterium]|nr:hypothetical protein [Candidatus Uhrbacteria bacterium]